MLVRSILHALWPGIGESDLVLAYRSVSAGFGTATVAVPPAGRPGPPPTRSWRSAATMARPCGARGSGPRKTRRFVVPADAPPGRYRLKSGVWRPEVRARLRLTASDLPGERDAVLVGTVTVVE